MPISTSIQRPVDPNGALSFSSPKPRRPANGRRRGATMVEFAIVAPMLFLFLFAMIEAGRMVMVQQILTNAAREGARRGILEQTTNADVETVVSDYLQNTTVPGATVTVSPDSFIVWKRDPITVSVSIPMADVSWLPLPIFFGDATLTGQCVMGAERPE